MADLQMEFKKEPQPRKVILISTLAVLVSTFLPWTSVSFGGFGSVSVNGWHSFGILTALGSIALILYWLLPKLKVNLKLQVKEELVYKILSLAMLAGPVIWLLESGFEFSFLGIGFYLGLIASAVTVYFVFLGGKALGGKKPEVK